MESLEAMEIACTIPSVATLLSGHELDAELLRLSSVINAVDHFDLYMTKVLTDMYSEVILYINTISVLKGS